MPDVETTVRVGDLDLRRGASLPQYSITLSLQKLIMITTANRDFAMTHLNDDAAIASGAPAAYVDMISLMAFFEACLMSILGPHAMLTSISGMKLSNFVTHGSPILITSEVISVEIPSPKTVRVELLMRLYQRDETPATSATISATIHV